MTAFHSHLPVLQVIVPMLTAPLVILLNQKRLPWAVATAASLCAFAIAVTLTMSVMAGQKIQYSLGAWPAPWGIELAVDAFSALMLLVVTGASSVALLAGAQSLDRDIEDHRQPLFYAAWLLALSGLVGILVTADAFNIFVFMEISSLASYVLISGGTDKRALPSVFKYLMMGTIGATFYLIGVGLIYMMTGTLNLADMTFRVEDVADQTPILLAAGFITVGLALKGAIFPLHAWLPNAYTHAPNMVTVFLAACATKVAIYVLFRFDFIVFQPNLVGHDFQLTLFLLPLSILAILVGSSVAMFEPQLKRLLAWSSIAQIGYITLGVSFLNVTGITASLLHVFNHSLAKGALFLVMACLGMRIAQLRIDNIAGIAKKMPWTMAAFVLAGLSLIGVPGTAGFISKWYLITAAFESGTMGIAIVVIILISSLMAVVYIWRIVETAYFRQPEGDSEITEAPLPLLVMTWVIVLMNIYFGFVPGVPIELATGAAQLLHGQIP